MESEAKATADCCQPPRRHWYQRKLILASVAIAIVYCLSPFIGVLKPFNHSMNEFIGLMWWAVCLGLSIGACIDYYVPRQYIAFYLASNRKRSIFIAVILGFFMSVCSHGILAIAMQIYKKGASTGAVIAFLLASPWANLPLTLVLFSFFGPKAFFFMGSAIVIAIITGLIYRKFEQRGWVETQAPQDISKEFNLVKDLKHRYELYPFSLKSFVQKDIPGIVKGLVELADMVLWWIIIGSALAALASAYIPQDLWSGVIGPNFRGLLTTLGIASVIEVCSEGTSPLAFEVYRQTGGFGNAFVFLMAGVVTDYTEIALIWQNIGKKSAILLPIVTVPMVLGLGVFANYYF
ncbi:MAG: uncharacterized membrane protein YraQ (UPF0718 family) [Candidatus Omnitrophota bacterium]